jgi:hypothetical protein
MKFIIKRMQTPEGDYIGPFTIHLSPRQQETLGAYVAMAMLKIYKASGLDITGTPIVRHVHKEPTEAIFAEEKEEERVRRYDEELEEQKQQEYLEEASKEKTNSTTETTTATTAESTQESTFSQELELHYALMDAMARATGDGKIAQLRKSDALQNATLEANPHLAEDPTARGMVEDYTNAFAFTDAERATLQQPQSLFSLLQDALLTCDQRHQAVAQKRHALGEQYAETINLLTADEEILMIFMNMVAQFIVPQVDSCALNANELLLTHGQETVNLNIGKIGLGFEAVANTIRPHTHMPLWPNKEENLTPAPEEKQSKTPTPQPFSDPYK